MSIFKTFGLFVCLAMFSSTFSSTLYSKEDEGETITKKKKISTSIGSTKKCVDTSIVENEKKVLSGRAEPCKKTKSVKISAEETKKEVKDLIADSIKNSCNGVRETFGSCEVKEVGIVEGTGSYLNMRSDSTTESGIVAQVPESERLVVRERKNGQKYTEIQSDGTKRCSGVWYKVYYDGQYTGYVNSLYLNCDSKLAKLKSLPTKKKTPPATTPLTPTETYVEPTATETYTPPSGEDDFIYVDSTNTSETPPQETNTSGADTCADDFFVDCTDGSDFKYTEGTEPTPTENAETVDTETSDIAEPVDTETNTQPNNGFCQGSARVDNLSTDTTGHASVNMREGPGYSEFSVVTSVPGFSNVNILGVNENGQMVNDSDIPGTSTIWYQVEFASNQGWINSLYLVCLD